MKKKLAPKKITHKKRPDDQTLIEGFIFFNPETCTKSTPIIKKTLSSSNILNESTDNNSNGILKDITNNENKNKSKNVEIEFVQRQNELKLINRGIFFDQENKKLIEEYKSTNPEFYEKLTKEEEIIFPIILETNLGVEKNFDSENISELINKLLTKLNSKSNWIEVIPIINLEITNVQIKDIEKENNFINLGFITKSISYNLYLITNNNSTINLKIFLNKNGRKIAIFLGLAHEKYKMSIDYIDKENIFYKLHFNGDSILSNNIYKILIDLKKKYSPLENSRPELVNLLKSEIIEKKKLENNLKNNDENNKRKNIDDYLVNNVENILDIINIYEYLFTDDDKYYYNIYLKLTKNEKSILLKFLKRKSKWQNINKLFINNNFENKKDTTDDKIQIIISLKEKKLISNFWDMIGKFPNINFNKLFEFLNYCSMDDLKSINNNLNKLCKNLNSSNKEKNYLSPLVKENYINNPFYGLENFLSFNENNNILLKEIVKKTSEKITSFNWDKEKLKNSKIKKDSKFNPLFENSKDNRNINYNNQYINTYLNYSNFKCIHLFSNFTVSNKLNLINDIINKINSYLNEKRRSFMENFVSIVNQNNSKEKNLEKIFESCSKNLFTLNEKFAKILDITSRLFFFYSDCKDLNDVSREFYDIEKYENFKYSCEDNNRIFNNKEIFYLYDTLYQVKNSYLIFSMFEANEQNNPKFFYDIMNPLIPYLLEITNMDLFKVLDIEDFNIIDFEKYNNKLIKILSENFEPKDNFFNLELMNEKHLNINYNKLSFVNKYTPEYISAQLLYYIVLNLEKNKKFYFANFVYLFLLNSFNNSFILKQRGFIYYRLILNYSHHIKIQKIAIEILNICIKYDILKYKVISNGDLFKLKSYYIKLDKMKNNQKNKGNNKILNLLISYNFPDINSNNFDFKQITKEIEADSLYSSFNGRRQYAIDDSKYSQLITVEDYALDYYYKKEKLEGVHGENSIIPALFNLFLWEEIFNDNVKMVFQSKYQAFPLDFFEKDFYFNRKEIIDKKLEIIKNYKKDDLIKLIDKIYDTKNGIKNPCIEWKSFIYDREILKKIAIAFTADKLVEIFKVILFKGLKSVKSGMPDLFLWNENQTESKYKVSHFYAESGSLKLVEVKSVNDKLSDNQRFWIKTFYDNKINVEILHIK